ncbi:MAG TPA: hypothetical protein VHM30_15120 [Gemmatimonadaceae bacterium]|nr:hypothetical protein [Gemmatimonadaceae bacterium]
MISTSIRRRGVAVALILGAALALPRLAATQSAPAVNGWRALLGCWRPLSPTGDPATRWSVVPAGDAPTLCILPGASEVAAELVTVSGDSIIARDSVTVGTTRSRERDGCSGTETATWSADGARIYLRSQYTCSGGLTQTSNGILAVAADEHLLDIQQTVRGEAKAVHVIRYVQAPVPAALPRAIAAAVNANDLPATMARGAASAPLTVAAVAEASHALAPDVVEALLIERGDQWTTDAKTLVALADAGVPGRVTDLLVALSYPRKFALRPTTGAPVRLDSTRLRTADRVLLPPPGYSSLYGLYGYSPYGYGRYGYSPFAYAPYGYAGYGGYGGYGYYQPPIVVVRNEPPRSHGRVVNGRGYTRDGSAGQSGGSPSPSTGSSASSGGSSGSSGGSSGSSGSSSSGSSGGGETRTAKPRP